MSANRETIYISWPDNDALDNYQVREVIGSGNLSIKATLLQQGVDATFDGKFKSADASPLDYVRILVAQIKEAVAALRDWFFRRR